MSSYSEGQTHQLMDALQSAGFTADHVRKLGQAGTLRLIDIRKVIDGEARITHMFRPSRMGHVPESTFVEPPLDFIIQVDRSVDPNYPDWSMGAMNPELERTGLIEYNLLTDVEMVVPENQELHPVMGHVIYENLVATGELVSHLGLADLEQIEKKGAMVFHKLFNGKKVFGWKSVVRFGHDKLQVPFLMDDHGKMLIDWRWLSNTWTIRHPALRFSK